MNKQWIACVLSAAAFGLSGAAFAACATEAQAKANVDKVEGDVADFHRTSKMAEAVTQKNISERADALVKQGKWTKQQRGKMFSTMLSSPEFLEIEKKKAGEFQTFMMSAESMENEKKKGRYIQACVQAEKMRASLQTILAHNNIQYGLMLAAVTPK